METSDKIIYTDYTISKDNLWMSYRGWVVSFSLYIMPHNNEKVYHENGMMRYAVEFITYTFTTYKKFTKLDEHKVNFVMYIFNNKLVYGQRLTHEEYIFLNDFFSNYIDITGIGDISKEREDPSTAFGRFE